MNILLNNNASIRISVGLVLAEIKDVANISLVVRVHKPASLKDVLPDLFNMTSSGTAYSLVVTQTVDLEALYKEAVSSSLNLLITLLKHRDLIT